MGMSGRLTSLTQVKWVPKHGAAMSVGLASIRRTGQMTGPRRTGIKKHITPILIKLTPIVGAFSPTTIGRDTLAGRQVHARRKFRIGFLTLPLVALQDCFLVGLALVVRNFKVG